MCQGKRRLISVVQSIADRGGRKGWGIPLPQVVGGIVFAVAYEIEGSLMVPITIHVLGNLAIFMRSMMS
ncbi:MAG: CPBP family intramembrane metalloprotease [Deltaproteobacteria bacterium]|nr:CPBP family intramembrane metalloprotease [Deltaproteobacteria bacterium]